MKNNLQMLKNRTWKFWLVFWLAAIFLLFGWFVFLEVKNRNIESLKQIVNFLPLGSQRKDEIKLLADIYQEMGGTRNEKTFLVLFQNNLELRPGGGFLGSFGVLKTLNGKIADVRVFDTGVYDNNIPGAVTPPAPLADILGIQSWKMRDSNWSPDFRENAREAEYFYKLGGGAENIDGVIAINTDTLNSILSITGPVKIDDYPGEYNDQTAILQLEYQVEKGFQEQGIEKVQRKNVMQDLAKILIQKIHSFRFSQQLELAGKLEDHLKKKDIQFYFKNEQLENEVSNLGWGGSVKSASGDYLMLVDANLNSLKSDYCIKREADYTADLSGSVPVAELKITYTHICRTKDWMTTDYRDWMRVYTPLGSTLEEATGQRGEVHPHTNNEEIDNSNADENNKIGVGVKSYEDLGKKIFAAQVFVPIGKSQTVVLKYQLPATLKSGNYNLLVQKQSGTGDLPIEINVRKADGSTVSARENLVSDKSFDL